MASGGSVLHNWMRPLGSRDCQGLKTSKPLSDLCMVDGVRPYTFQATSRSALMQARRHQARRAPMLPLLSAPPRPSPPWPDQTSTVPLLVAHRLACSAPAQLGSDCDGGFCILSARWQRQWHRHSHPEEEGHLRPATTLLVTPSTPAISPL